jgi:hypothetical protein
MPARVAESTMKNVRLVPTAIFEPMPNPNHADCNIRQHGASGQPEKWLAS